MTTSPSSSFLLSPGTLLPGMERVAGPGILLLAVLTLAGCASTTSAPVVDRGSVAGATTGKAAPPGPAGTELGAGYYTVKKGDTLYGIALDHGQDYKDIATWNSLDNPNLILIGQQLRVVPPDAATPVAGAGVIVRPVTPSAPVEVRPVGAAPAAPVALAVPAGNDGVLREPRGGKVPYSEEALQRARQPVIPAVPVADVAAARPAEARPAEQKAAADPKSAEPKATEPRPAGPEAIEWAWPASGKVITTFAEASGNKGIDIAGKTGDPVQAAASGVVSYAGAGLRGYGNLIVLRHNASFLSVYAHNSKILVKEKQSVSKGQKIAEMGSSETDSPRLHFEIRRQGKPADPAKFLPSR